MLVDVTRTLDALGIDYSERNSEANALCPMHHIRTGKEDNSPSWWINLESGMHICFSCNYKGNLLQLICDVNEFYKKDFNDRYVYDYAQAESWLSAASDVPIEKLAAIIKNLPNYLEPAPKPIEMSEARLAVFVEPPMSALSVRNITPEAAEEYGVLWDARRSNWILPLREPHLSKLMGWQEKGTLNRTFFNRPSGLQKSKTLFGLNTQTENRVIVVESPLDCLRMRSAGIESVVAICGATPSEEQVKLLRFSEKIIVALDNPKVDAAGKKGSDQFRMFARKYGLNLSFFNYGETGMKDPGDLTDDQLHWGIANAKTSILGEKAYV